MKSIFLGGLPAPVRHLVGVAVQKTMRRTLREHGIGRHDPEEILDMGRADLSALSAILGTKPFLLGDLPSSYDAIAYGFVANVLDVNMETPLKTHARGLTNLAAHLGRMKDRYFSSAG